VHIPAALIDSLQEVKGFDEESFKAVHNSGAQITSVRMNPVKTINISSSILDTAGKIPWCSHGYYLSERPSFTSDPLFHAGAYYVQEASSMFLEEALKQTVDLAKPLRVLDLCAAPGGKSTLIQSSLSVESMLVSNEVIKARVNILSENMTKWGASNVIVTNNDPKDFQRLPNYFDVIVVDAPCSGSGLFRKDPGAIVEWSENNVALCEQRQQRILADIFPALKAGGVLIYSTCSYSEAEDECIADWLIDEFRFESLQLETAPFPGIVETVSKDQHAFGYRFYPDKIKGEGFFIAAFRKAPNEMEEHRDKGQRSKPSTKDQYSEKEISILEPYVAKTGDYFFIKQNEEIIAMPKHLESDLEKIRSTLYIKKAGVTLGTLIRGELIPSHDLAMSTIINPLLPWIEVDRETALQYLRREEIQIDPNRKGWVLIKYSQLPLGWVKIMQNRINNYYPKEWRILNK
jgi:16S rRNA C967 or C1407 C5-methylase (RsmB/RsmF family)/NOL1/NOP2/fmu family ribosome biogenesis protein